jgi:superfamily II DNA or RNA helicase
MRPMLEINNITTRLTGVDEETERTVWKVLSFKEPGAEFSPAYKTRRRDKEGNLVQVWDGMRRLYSLPKHQFPTGLVSMVLPLLPSKPKINDSRLKPIQAFVPHRAKGMVLRAYQKEAVASATTSARGVVRVATGGGKSLIMADLIARKGVKTLVCVHLTPLLEQMRRSLQEALTVGQVGVIGDGFFAPRDVTVAMVQTLHARGNHPTVRRYLQSVGMVVFDETHHLAADSMYVLSQSLPMAYYRYGFSATPWRSDGRDMLINASTGKRIVNINASTLIRAGYLAKPKVYFFQVPAIHGTEGLPYPAQYKQVIVMNKTRNKLIAKIVKHALDKGEKVLVAVSQVTHGHQVLKYIQETVSKPWRCVFIRGENESKEKANALTGLNGSELDCVVATTVFGEGVDVPNLNVLINAKGNVGKVETIQVGGRALRITKTKKKATIIDFLDRTYRFLAHSRARYRTYLIEPEFEIYRVDEGGVKVPLVGNRGLTKGLFTEKRVF